MRPLSAHSVRYSYAEYVAFENSSNTKHEFLDGQIYGMAGGTPEHAALASTASHLLYAQLEASPCRPHSSDLRIHVRATGLVTYPDVAVICGSRERDPGDARAVTNPTLLVEVLSPSTEKYDRLEKFEHYKLIPSLRQYVLIAQDRRQVELWTRDGDAWTSSVANDGDVAELGSIDCRLDVKRLYDLAAGST